MNTSKLIQLITESEIFCDSCIEFSDAERENYGETQPNVTGTLTWKQYKTDKFDQNYIISI